MTFQAAKFAAIDTVILDMSRGRWLLICSSYLACSMEHPQLKEAVSHLDHIIPKSWKKG